MGTHLVIPANIWRRLDDHLTAAMPAETGAFLLLRSVDCTGGARLLARRVLLPEVNDWDRQTEDHLAPSGRWLSSVVGRAIDDESGFAFVHSHPDPRFPPHLSTVDQRTSQEWSRTLTPLVAHAVASLVWSPAGVAGWAFRPDHPEQAIDIDRVDVVGDGRITAMGPRVLRAATADLDDRQRRALGALGNDRLRSLTVGVVGVGGTGSPLAEILARMGVRKLILVDADRVDAPSNLRRIVGSSRADLAAKRLKVDVVGRYVESIDLGTQVVRVPADVRSVGAAENLLEADIIIGTTDTHSSRAYLNELAVRAGLPFLDVGLRVGTATDGQVSGMPVELRLVLPDTGCLWCRRVLDAGRIHAENLPPEERAKLAAEGYVQGVDAAVGSVAALNVFAASAAALAALRVCSGPGLPSPSVVIDGYEGYVHPLAAPINVGCVCSDWR